MFTYYAEWVSHFFEKIKPLVSATEFSMSEKVLQTLQQHLSAKLYEYRWEAAIFRRNLRFEKCYFYFLRPREWTRHILLSNVEKMWTVSVKRWKRSCCHCRSGPQSCCRSTIGCFYVKCSTLGKNLKWWHDALVYAGFFRFGLKEHQKILWGRIF